MMGKGSDAEALQRAMGNGSLSTHQAKDTCMHGASAGRSDVVNFAPLEPPSFGEPGKLRGVMQNKKVRSLSGLF